MFFCWSLSADLGPFGGPKFRIALQRLTLSGLVCYPTLACALAFSFVGHPKTSSIAICSAMVIGLGLAVFQLIRSTKRPASSVEYSETRSPLERRLNEFAEREATELMAKIESSDQQPIERQTYRRQLRALIRDEICPAATKARVLKRHHYLE